MDKSQVKNPKGTFDSEVEAIDHIKELAYILRSAKHVVAYTGAEISKGSKIPHEKWSDGTWTLKERGLAPSTPEEQTVQAAPTFCHVALTLLYKVGLVKYIMSTNIDGIHRASGLPASALAELRGNYFKEVCSRCRREYLREYDTSTNGCRKDHFTGRNCDDCHSDLTDCIIHEGESVSSEVLTLAMENALRADVALILGTPLKTSPIISFPPLCAMKCGKIVICNLSETLFDSQASLIVRVPLENILQMLLDELSLNSEIPSHTPQGFPITRPRRYNPELLQQQKQTRKANASNNNSTHKSSHNMNKQLQKTPAAMVSSNAAPVTSTTVSADTKPTENVEDPQLQSKKSEKTMK